MPVYLQLMRTYFAFLPFAFIEFLLAHDFVTLATGKVRRDREPREDEDRVFTWFIFEKQNPR